ncbi:MAG TPA: 7-cyano-7-deazaguanine synthase QueC [Elusimicrobiota bacterium]|nr:7-cyano-7-deazaguanine synthase QueC [Elusimicrobiota bacterium]
MPDTKAIVLLSGGLDSSTALYWALDRKKWDCHCLLFSYGQRHDRELTSAVRLARRRKCPYRVVTMRLPWGGSELLKTKRALPSRSLHTIGNTSIPSTYVPARNTIFLSYALSWADVLQCRNIVMGVNALDYSGYPDCRPAYCRAMQAVARQGTRMGAEQRRPIRLWTPLIRMTKAQIIRLGISLKVPYEDTWSCYAGRRIPCGKCDSCRLREKGFSEIGRADPLIPRSS